MGMPKVFISYRRDDSQHQADRIFDALTRVVPKKDIFIDIDGIPAAWTLSTTSTSRSKNATRCLR